MSIDVCVVITNATDPVLIFKPTQSVSPSDYANSDLLLPAQVTTF